MSVSRLSVPARRAIFEAMVAMAWADARLEREEILAVQAAGRVLRLPEDALDALDAGPPSVKHIAAPGLPPSERRTVYLCAAWLSTVDATEDSSEGRLLSELARALELDAASTEALRDDARALRASTPPTVAWWQELESLLERVAR